MEGELKEGAREDLNLESKWEPEGEIEGFGEYAPGPGITLLEGL